MSVLTVESMKARAEALAKIVSDAYDLKIIMSGSRCSTDGNKTIYVPEIEFYKSVFKASDDDIVNYANYSVLHEVGHIIYTGNVREVMRQAVKQMDATGKRYSMKKLHTLLNIIEDWRMIERMSVDRPGVKPYADKSNRSAINIMLNDKKLDLEYSLLVMLTAPSFGNLIPMEYAKKVIPLANELVVKAITKGFQNTTVQDTINWAMEYYFKMHKQEPKKEEKNPEPPKPPQPPKTPPQPPEGGEGNPAPEPPEKPSEEDEEGGNYVPSESGEEGEESEEGGDSEPVSAVDKFIEDMEEHELPETLKKLAEKSKDDIKKLEKELEKIKKEEESLEYRFDSVSHLFKKFPPHWLKYCQNEDSKTVMGVISPIKVSTELDSRVRNYEDTQVKVVASQLKKIFQKAKQDKISGTKSGYLNTKALYKVGLQSSDIFYKKKADSDGDVAVYILLDGSGSMSGIGYQVKAEHKKLIDNNIDSATESKIAKAILSASIIVKALIEMNVPVKCCSFSSERYSSYPSVVMNEHKDWTSNKVDLVKYQSRGNNRDGYAIRAAIADLSERPERHKLLIVLSDGCPACDLGNTQYLNSRYCKSDSSLHDHYAKSGIKLVNGTDDTAKAIRESRAKGIKTFGMYIPGYNIRESELDSIKEMYGTDFATLSIAQEFPSIIVNIIKRILV